MERTECRGLPADNLQVTAELACWVGSNVFWGILIIVGSINRPGAFSTGLIGAICRNKRCGDHDKPDLAAEALYREIQDGDQRITVVIEAKLDAVFTEKLVSRQAAYFGGKGSHRPWRDRSEDVVRLGVQHIRDGRLRYRQAKNEHRKPIDLDIPVHPDLLAIIEATPTDHLTFLSSTHGRAFTPAGFGNKFREWCNEAGLPHCSAHGLRKAAAACIAERGATAHEMMVITGHRSLEEVGRYTRAARQKSWPMPR